MEFEILSEPKKLYRKMLEDIESAKKKIFLETYIYDKDKIGKKFRDALVKKAKQGVAVNLLIDAWGSTAKKDFFASLEKARGKVRFFKEFRYVTRIIDENHERNHRKLLVIDDEIGYIGSANITATCLDWRELAIRLKGKIVEHLSNAFRKSWNSYAKPLERRIKNVIHKGFEIIQETPSPKFSPTEWRYIQLLKSAKKEILIEVPYFVPSHGIRRALRHAVKRGVSVKLLTPFISDVKLMDIIRDRYFGELYKERIQIYYYLPGNLHSKLLIIDDKFFMLGSSNLDYRSFLYQYDINLLGRDKRIIKSLKEFFNSGFRRSRPFNYEEWRARSSLKKIVEIFFLAIKKYL